MEYFYSAGVMGYGNGRSWHKYYNFPNFTRVTKTLTMNPKIGYPFAIIKAGNTVWNKVSLHNIGILNWYFKHYSGEENTVVSIFGTDEEVVFIANFIVNRFINDTHIKGIELNLSCPNIKPFYNRDVPSTKLPLYLKLNYLQDPYMYDLDNVTGIRLNSVPKFFGGISGKMAQKYNWPWIEKFNKEGLNVAGCSCNTMDDIKHMEDIGCKEIGLGSIILTNPHLVETLK